MWPHIVIVMFDDSSSILLKVIYSCSLQYAPWTGACIDFSLSHIQNCLKHAQGKSFSHVTRIVPHLKAWAKQYKKASESKTMHQLGKELSLINFNNEGCTYSPRSCCSGGQW